ncbi:MAG: DUF4386 domain-containing protein [Anaerolineae bacterium]
MRDLSLQAAARISGIGLLAMAALAILGTLGTQSIVVAGDAIATAHNAATGEFLFRVGICAWLAVAILDVIVALALFVVLRPVNNALSLLGAWFRVAYAAVFVVAISNLLLAIQVLTAPAQTMLALDAFKDTWTAGLVLFGVHLALVGYLVYVSRYIPRLLGVLLLIAAAGYLIANFGKILYPAYGGALDAIIAVPAAIGEVAFAIWLLVRAARLGKSLG